MDDQANDLRRLVVRSARPQPAATGGRPALVVLSAGKGGVGTTTLAVNLAVAAAEQRLRTILVDADPRGGDAAILCGVRERHTLADVLAGRRQVSEVLHTGPCNLQILPGLRGLENLSDYPPAAMDRVLDQLQGPGVPAELIVLDAGNSPSRMVQRLWRSADVVLAVTSPEATSIVDTYAAIKILAEGGEVGQIHCLVNLAPNAEAAKDAHRRLAQACQRFLGLSLRYGGHVPADPRAARAGRACKAFMVAAANCRSAHQVRRLAAWLAVTVGQTRGATAPATAKLGHRLPVSCNVQSYCLIPNP